MLKKKWELNKMNLKINKTDFPAAYPRSLIPYSWNFNGHYGILPYWNHYCKIGDKSSIMFLKNFIITWMKDKLGLTNLNSDLMEYINFLIRCFNISWDEDQECFHITMKRQKNDRKMTVFTKFEFFDMSEKIGLNKIKAKKFLTEILKSIEENYNNII